MNRQEFLEKLEKIKNDVEDLLFDLDEENMTIEEINDIEEEEKARVEKISYLLEEFF